MKKSTDLSNLTGKDGKDIDFGPKLLMYFFAAHCVWG